MYCKYKITQTAPTFAALMGLTFSEGFAEPNSVVVEKAMTSLPEGVESFDRAFIYNPDAVGLWLYEKYTELFARAVARSDIQIPVESMMPSITPVCFASIYSGREPEGHGIIGFEWPILKVDTLFDLAIRAGKKVAIVAVEGSSMSRIFKERELDYFIFKSYEEVFAKALELIRDDNHDLICMYNHTYDSAMHKFAPESEQALTTLEQNAIDFETIVKAIRENWSEHNTVYGFCPDHGCHAVPEERVKAGSIDLGTHGSNLDCDMKVIHMFGTATKNKQ